MIGCSFQGVVEGLLVFVCFNMLSYTGVSHQASGAKNIFSAQCSQAMLCANAV